MLKNMEDYHLGEEGALGLGTENHWLRDLKTTHTQEIL